MSKSKTDIKKVSLGLTFLILMLAFMLQTYNVSAGTTTIAFGPPYYVMHYQASNPVCVPGVPCVQVNYAECWHSDTNVYGTEIHVGMNFCSRRWVHLGIAKDFTRYTSKTVRAVADFRIEGYLDSIYEGGGDATLKININLQKWVRSWWGYYYWSQIASWPAVEYYVEWGESMSFEGDNIHFTGPYFSMSSGTYRLIFNVWGESFNGWFFKSPDQEYEPGKIYFDSIGYQYESSGGGGGCPILSVFDGNEYLEEGLLDIHNLDGIDEIYEHNLINQPLAIKNRYHLRLTEHYKTISHIDRVELWGKLENGHMIKLPLLSAIHNELGQVEYKLRFSDDKKIIIKGANHNNGVSQFIDLQFIAPHNLGFTEFLFVIEGNNMIIK